MLWLVAHRCGPQSRDEYSVSTEELKSLTRYRFDKVKERAKLKSSISRLVCILFPELEKLVSSLHLATVYALLEEFPGAKQIAKAHLTRLKSLLENASKGRYKRDMAVAVRDAARNSIGSKMPAKSLELQHTIRLIQELDTEIDEIEAEIEAMMEEIHSPITTIQVFDAHGCHDPGRGWGSLSLRLLRQAVGLCRNVTVYLPIRTAQKLLPAHGETRFPNLRGAFYNTTKYVVLLNPILSSCLAKKRAEGKHYNVAISHAAKKLVRLIFAMEKSKQPYRSAA